MDMFDYTGETVILQDEDGNEISFKPIDRIAYEGKEYIVLYTLEDENSDEVVIMEIAGSEGEEEYVWVESDELLDTVFEIFQKNQND